MRSLLCFLLLSSPLGAQVGVGRGAPAPALDDAVLTSGLTTSGPDGAPWAYVVWRSPGSGTLAGRVFGVHLQAVPGGGFQQIARVQPVTDLPSLELLLARAASLGADHAMLERDLRALLRQRAWAGGVDANGIPVNASPFDAAPLVQKLAMVMGRAVQQAEAWNAVESMANVHPALRMALGRAWAGRLPAGAGPVVIELREQEGGAAGAVLGRVQLTPGVTEPLAAPGRVVQVPHLKPKSDLTIRLRWAVPDELRRQQLQVLGFRVYRISRADAEAHGLPLSANMVQVEQFVAAHPSAVVSVNEAPVPVKKLYSEAEVDVFEFAGADPAPHFIADDANRDQPMQEGALEPRFPGFSPGSEWRYFVRAVDLLGRVGPPSPVGQGIALRTLPPDVPQGLTVADLPVGENGQRHPVLRWRANKPPTGVPGRVPTVYAVYRGFGPEDWQGTSLLPLEDPFTFSTLQHVGFVSHGAADAEGWLSYTDMDRVPTEANLNRSVWYAVTAIRETPLDAAFPSVHDRVQSAPSAPAFGIFRDRAGPGAAVGFVDMNCGRLVTRVISSGVEPRDAVADEEKRLVHVRVRCTRRRGDVEGVRFFFNSGRVNPVPLHESPVLPFAGDVVVYEHSFYDTQTSLLNIACTAYGADGCVSITSISEPSTPAASEMQWIVHGFEAGRFSATDFVPTAVLANLGAEVFFDSHEQVGRDTRRGNLPAGLEGRTLVVEEFIHDDMNPAFYELRAVCVVRGNAVLFPWEQRRLAPGQQPVFRATLLPEDGRCVCVHDARPPGVEKVIPITLATTVPETTREWRLYRRVDGGDLTLVKSLAIDPAEIPPEHLAAEDKALPPYGAVVSYFAQCFDGNHNPSPLAFLGKVSLLPELATPVLNLPEMLEASAGLGRVTLRWFCPPAGVDHFRVDVVPLNPADPLPIASVFSNLITQNVQMPVQGVLIPQSYRLPGEEQAKLFVAMRYFETQKVTVAAPLFSATFSVAPGVAYIAKITAYSEGKAVAESGTARLFTWQAPPGGVVESLVPWPARPLPEVVTHPDVRAQRTVDWMAQPGFQPEKSTIFDAGSAALYPMCVSVGLLPLPVFDITHDVGDPMAAAHPAEFTSTLPAFGGQQSSTLPLSKGADPAAYLLPDVLPCTLYRQTVLAGGQPGALVQVTPLRTGVAHQVRQQVINSTHSTITTIRDPFVKTLSYQVNDVPLSALVLVDTQPVEEGATYRYFLVNYRPDGEIRRVYDCGTVSVPESP